LTEKLSLALSMLSSGIYSLEIDTQLSIIL